VQCLRCVTILLHPVRHDIITMVYVDKIQIIIGYQMHINPTAWQEYNHTIRVTAMNNSIQTEVTQKTRLVLLVYKYSTFCANV